MSANEALGAVASSLPKAKTHSINRPFPHSPRLTHGQAPVAGTLSPLLRRGEVLSENFAGVRKGWGVLGADFKKAGLRVLIVIIPVTMMPPMVCLRGWRRGSLGQKKRPNPKIGTKRGVEVEGVQKGRMTPESPPRLSRQRQAHCTEPRRQECAVRCRSPAALARRQRKELTPQAGGQNCR